MSQTARVAIVVALLAVVGVVVVIKNRGQSAPAGAVSTSAVAPVAAVPSPTATAALPRLVDLGADKCIPCKMMAPILEELKKEMAGRLNVDFIDVWKNPQAGEGFAIKLIPTQIFFDANGKELYRHEGFFSKADILAKWKELGVNLDAKRP